MDGWDMLDLAVEELMKTVVRKHRMKAEAYYRYEFDFSVEVEGDTYEEALDMMAYRLAQHNHYATSFTWTEVLTIRLPVNDDDGMNLNEFVCERSRSHIYDYQDKEIGKHPTFVKAKYEAQEAERKKQEEKEVAKLEAQKKADKETYERLKKEFGE